LDTTAPDLDLKIVKRTNNSILVAAYGYDAQSKIKKYTFKIGNGIPVSKATNSKVATYEFTGLKSNQEYEITVSVENENTTNENIDTYRSVKTIKATTLNTGIPTFKISGSSYSNSKEVIITYPQIDGGINYYDISYDKNTKLYTIKNKIKIPLYDPEDPSIELDGVIKYELLPGMTFGGMDNLAVSGYIDLDKLGTGIFEINNWRYYNSNDSVTLTYGWESYPMYNTKITNVKLEFFDVIEIGKNG
jgi:hypothetical protein